MSASDVEVICSGLELRAAVKAQGRRDALALLSMLDADAAVHAAA